MGTLDSRALAFWVPIVVAVPSAVLSLYIGFQWIAGMFQIGKAVYPAAPLDPHWQPPVTSLGSAFLPIAFVLAMITFLLACLTSALVAKHVSLFWRCGCTNLPFVVLCTCQGSSRSSWPRCWRVDEVRVHSRVDVLHAGTSAAARHMTALALSWGAGLP